MTSDAAALQGGAEALVPEDAGGALRVAAGVVGVAVEAVGVAEFDVQPREGGARMRRLDQRAPDDADAVERVAGDALAGRQSAEQGVAAETVFRDLTVTLRQRSG